MWWFLGPGLLLVAGVAAFVAGFMSTVEVLTQPREALPEDGTAQVVDVTPGTDYLIWFHEDRAESVTCEVTDPVTGSAVPLTEPSVTVSINDVEGVFKFTPTSFTVAIACNASSQHLTTPASVSEHPRMSAFASAFVLTLVAPLVLGGIAVVWAIVLTVLMFSRGERVQPTPR